MYFFGHDFGDVGGRVEKIREPSHESGNLYLLKPRDAIFFRLSQSFFGKKM